MGRRIMMMMMMCMQQALREPAIQSKLEVDNRLHSVSPRDFTAIARIPSSPSATAMASQVVCMMASSTVLPSSSLSSVAVTRNASSSISSCNQAAPTNKNGKLVVRAAISSSEVEDCSRRTAMLAGASGVAAGLLLLLPVSSAEARTVNPGVRRKLRKELDKLKEEAVQNVEETEAKVQGVANKAQATVRDKVAGK